MSLITRSFVGVGVALALAAVLGLGPNLTFGQDPGNGTDVKETDVKEVVVSAPSEAEPGESVEVAVDVLDASGAPLVGVECTFSVASQPGDDASVDAGPVTTDASGSAVAMLSVGSTEGTIVVEADCEGVTATVSVVAGVAAAPPGALPASGNGGYAPAGGGQLMIVSMLAAVVVALSGTCALAIARARRNRAG